MHCQKYCIHGVALMCISAVTRYMYNVIAQQLACTCTVQVRHYVYSCTCTCHVHEVHRPRPFHRGALVHTLFLILTRGMGGYRSTAHSQCIGPKSPPRSHCIHPLVFKSKYCTYMYTLTLKSVDSNCFALLELLSTAQRMYICTCTLYMWIY